MASLTIQGTLPKIKPEDAAKLAIYLVSGNEILARASADKDRKFSFTINRHAIAVRSAGVEIVVGPAGMNDVTDRTHKLQRVVIDANTLQQSKDQLQVSLNAIDLSDEILRLWWLWCRDYCVSGVVLGPNGCPAPGAQVTISSVAHASGGGFTVTPEVTVTADINGHFTACFLWCSGCYGWPCWPIWWFCWPWWWEWDILHIIEQIEARVPQIGPLPPGPLNVQNVGLPLRQPNSTDLMVGQGFAEARSSEDRLVPDSTRTDLIRRKLANPGIRALFPWWWWCCENPNIIFTVTQGANLIVNEDPATDTRWCFPNNSNVTLVGNENTITTCGGDPKPAQGFVWTRVGNTLVSLISEGYADGSGNASDLAFTGMLDIYGEFALGSPAAYYQVDAGLWTGTANPARGGTAPAGPGSSIASDLYNTAIMLHPGPVISFDSVKMGPFTNGGLTNLYATQEQRQTGAAIPGLPAFPAGTFMGWSNDGLKVTSLASQLAGGSLGGVTLSVAAYDSTFNPLSLPPNPDDQLTLEIDTSGLSTAHINSFNAFDSGGNPVTSTGSTSDCPAFDVGAGGYVVLNVSVNDANGHLCYYELVPNFGHGSTGITSPDIRGYETPTPFVPAPAPGPYTQPVIAQKSFVGGTENITFYPMANCCYDFRLNVEKRVTDGTNVASSYVADFWTATLKVS
jgi:hypothetical protein